jgi:hypothetical protein
MASVSEHITQQLQFLKTQKVFLGREFLTWLWFYTETRQHSVSIPKLGDFKLYVDDKIILTSPSGCAKENSLKGGTPAYAAEAKSALLGGKLVSEARFILQDTERQWQFSVRSEDLSLRQVRLPSIKSQETENYLSARIELLNELLEIFDHLYEKFVSLKNSNHFNLEVQKITEWIHEKESLEFV